MQSSELTPHRTLSFDFPCTKIVLTPKDIMDHLEKPCANWSISGNETT